MSNSGSEGIKSSSKPAADRDLQAKPNAPDVAEPSRLRPVNDSIAALLAEPEIQLIMRADHVEEHELLATLSAIGVGLREARRADDAESQEFSIDLSEYRRGVGIVLLNHEKRVFVGRRIGATENPWQMPQGGIDPGEGPLEAALRELAEEIGTNDVEVVAETRSWLHYELPVEITNCGWRGRWKGQRQKWFVMRYRGRDFEINVATEHPEFADWRWVSHEELPDLAVSFKRQVYLNLVGELDGIIARGRD